MKFITKSFSVLSLVVLLSPQLLAMNQRHVPAHGIPGNGQQASQELKQIADEAQEASQQKSEDCAICLEPMQEREQHSLISLCQKHTFHTRCIAQAVQQSARCPLCRRGFSQEEQKKVESELMEFDPEIRKKLEWEKRYGCLKNSSRLALFIGALFAIGFSLHSAQNVFLNEQPNLVESLKALILTLLGGVSLYILDRA